MERRVLSLEVAPNASVRVGTLGTVDPRQLALWRAAPGIIGGKEASLPQPVWHPASAGGRVTGSDPSLQEPRGGCVSVFPSVIWVHAAHLGMRRCCRANLGAQHEKYSLCYSFYNRQLPKQLRRVPQGRLPPGPLGLCSGEARLVNPLCSLDSREMGQPGERGPSLQTGLLPTSAHPDGLSP